MILPATEADNSPAKVFQDKIAARIRSDIGDLELFSRQDRPGWSHWGNEIGKFPA